MGCPVWRTYRQTQPAALVQLAAALAQMRPASGLVLAQMRPVTKMMTTLSHFWTRSLRTRTPTRMQRGGPSRINPKPHLVSHYGDQETKGVGEPPWITPGESQILETETLSDPSLIHSCSLYDTQTLLATIQLQVEGTADLTPAHTAQSVLRTPPTSADTFCATQESDCIPVSFVKRASSLPLSSLCTLAHIQGSGLLAVLSVVNVSPAAGTWERTNGTFTWGRGPLLAQSAERDLPTGGTLGCTITESTKEIPTIWITSRSLT